MHIVLSFRLQKLKMSTTVSSVCDCFYFRLTIFQKICSHVILLLLAGNHLFRNSHDHANLILGVQALKLSSSSQQLFQGGYGCVTTATQTQTVVVGEEARGEDVQSRPRTTNKAPASSSSRITTVFHPAPPRRGDPSTSDTRAEPRCCKKPAARPNTCSTTTPGQRNLLDEVQPTCEITSATRAATATERAVASPNRSAASEFLPFGRSAEASKVYKGSKASASKKKHEDFLWRFSPHASKHL